MERQDDGVLARARIPLNKQTLPPRPHQQSLPEPNAATILELSTAMIAAKGMEGELSDLATLLTSNPQVFAAFQAHPILRELLLEIARHGKVALKSVKVNKNLADLTKEEAKSLANNFQAELRICAVLETGVEDWIQSSPALIELDGLYSFFRPLMLKVGFHYQEGSSGLKARLYCGAAISVLDMVSDLYMIYQYRQEGDNFSGGLIAGSIGVS